MTAPENDDAAREEIRGRTGETFLVEAGAGTGKTSALVERVVALVAAGHPIESIVAITFTDKAAAELRDRVRSGLEAAHATAVGETRAAYAAALDALDRAQVSTIHAFCQRLLRRFAPELGVDPAFQIQDEVLADRRFEEQWRTYLDELGRDHRARAAVDRLLGLGLSTADISTLAASLWKQPDLAPRLRQRPLTAPAAAWPDLEALRVALRALPLDLVPAADKLREKLEALLRTLDLLVEAGDGRESLLAGLAPSLPKAIASSGAQANWARAGPGARDHARSIGEGTVTALQETLAALRSEALVPLLEYVVDFVTRDTETRGRQGLLVFDDLILRVRDLLSTNPAALRSLRESFHCILIDEFQDTDPLQVDIALSFATDPDSGRLDPGRLFLVGDPKQSIYRFRRADMALYAQVRRRLEGEGARLPQLHRNRRSTAAVIDWVNSVFRGLIGEGDEPEFQPPYRPIAAARAPQLAGPGVAWFGGDLQASAREVRHQEAEAVAAVAMRAIQEGWQVQERATGEVRPAAFRDLAVLIPTRAILSPLERALLDAGIPYRVEGGSLVYGTQEVRDLINCLAAIDDPADEVAVVAALRSPAYACSDVDLALFKLEQRGSFNYLHPGLDAWQGPVASGLRSLRAFHDSRHAVSLAFLVERFLAQRAVVDAGILDQRSRDSFRRARFVVDQARAFEAAGPESLRAFVAWLEARSGRAILDNEGAGLDDDEDAVRVLTVHGAKGLEFPIVIVAGIGGSPGSDRRVFGLDRDTGDISVSIGAGSRGRFTLGPVAQIAQQETRHLQRERDRILYVAATRARDHLVVSLFHKYGTKDSGAARLIEHGARDRAARIEPPPLRRVGANSLAALHVDDVAVPLDEFDARRDALVSRARMRTFTSATGLAGLPEVKKETSDDSEPWARGRGGTHVGRAVHAGLQSLRWDASSAEVEAVALAQAVAEAVPDRAAEVAALIRRALDSKAAARARSARRVLREVPFAFPLDGVLVEGFVDVVLDTEQGLEIVDWKTDDVGAEEAAERLRHYELQAGLYALGLQEAASRPVTRITYVFVRPLQELSPGDPADLAARARALLAAAGPPPSA